MKDLFAHLLQRARGEDVPAPVLPSRFEQPRLPAEPWGEIEEFVSGRSDAYARARSSEPHPMSRQPAREVRTDEVGAERIQRIEAPEHVTAPMPPLPESDSPEAPPVAAGSHVPALDLQSIIAAALRQHDRAVSDEVPVPDDADWDRDQSARDDRPPASVAPVVVSAAAVVSTGPATAAAPEREPSPPTRPTVEVRIGRIEITAAPAPSPRPAHVSRTARPTAAALSLRDYLSRRQRR
jgi:hypothetical protein